MDKHPKTPPPLPTKEQVKAFIESSDTPVGKREIARAFNIRGADRIYLKKILKELVGEGSFDLGRKRELSVPGSLPGVAVLEISNLDPDGDVLATPTHWDHDSPPPTIYVEQAPSRRTAAPGKGDRILARLSKQKDGTYTARIIRHLKTATGPLLGVYTQVGEDGRVQPTDRKIKKEVVVRKENSLGANSGDVVICELLPGRQMGLPEGKITERLGAMGDSRSISLIAIHAHGLPHEFSDKAIAEAEKAQPVDLGERTDIRDWPIVTIDPADARDRDDAVWAAPDDDPANKGGWQVLVAIADVAHYVTYGSALDREARTRGNSVYFPDRVVPMLPHELSSDLCSLHDDVDRPVMAVHMWFDADGNKLRHRFMRAMIRSKASLTYTQAQNAYDGHPDEMTAPLTEGIIKPLFGAYYALKKARDRRQPLDLDLPERKIELNEDGFIKAVHKKTRFAAHMMIEEFMIQANVSAAETLIEKRRPCMFRVHEEPDREKLEGLREILADMDISFAKGQVLRTATFNNILAKAQSETDKELISSLILRSQAQAVYSPENLHHFGLHLKNYAHFTSPIRRYADLLVHRSLISALHFGKDGLRPEEEEAMSEIGEKISGLERRAMVAERQTLDRFTAVFLANQVGAVFQAKVTGVTRAGLFLTLDDSGADALAPISTLGHDFFMYDEDRHRLIGERTGVVYRLADRLAVQLREVDIVTGSTIVSIEDGNGGSAFDAKKHRRGRTTTQKKSARGGGKPGFGPKKRKRTTPKGEKRKKARK
ncbi:ribonuclease R [Sneathiella chinensis]|uniref:Ribonuclease R n=1 Tax=Sneathiella chinensis TaxID=349750 RepID=A0ABQ5U794_9PROT|nr:ribonuclease R [Sneathiella chinensis]GLQ07666.1 ribonuclease R [Sneathiella chinensis]